MLRKLPLYPFLIAIWPPLALAAKNPMEVANHSDIALALSAGCCVAAITFVTVWLFSRDGSTAAVAAAVLALGFWWFRTLVFALTGSPIIHAVRLNTVAPILVLSSYAGLAYLSARRLGRPLATRIGTMNLFAVLLAAFPTISLVRSGIQPELADVIGPPPSAMTLAADSEAPDIYILIVDSYAGHESLLSDHGFDNSKFLEDLRSRGFFVPNRARANYSWTFLAIAAMLNWNYVQDLPLLHQTWATATEEEVYSVIANNRTFRSLLERGYQLAFIPSSPAFVRSHSWAEVTSEFGGRVPTEFEATWYRMTPLPELRRIACQRLQCAPRNLGGLESAEAFNRKFKAIAALQPSNRPRLVFAHLLLPHQPFVYHSDCTPRHPPLWPMLDDHVGNELVRAAYIEQLICLNRKLVELIDTIQASTSRPPIIVLQSDHGQRYGLREYRSDRAEESSGRVEWYDIFAAYLAPQSLLVHLDHDVSPINAFRALFGGESGKPLPPVAHREYWSPDDARTELQEVFRAEPFQFQDR